MEFKYVPKGVCSKEFHFEMDGDQIRHVDVWAAAPATCWGSAS